MKNKKWVHKTDRLVSAYFTIVFAFLQVKKHIDYNEKVKDIEKNIKKQTRKVEKLQEDLERQIYNHVEL